MSVASRASSPASSACRHTNNNHTKHAPTHTQPPMHTQTQGPQETASAHTALEKYVHGQSVTSAAQRCKYCCAPGATCVFVAGVFAKKESFEFSNRVSRCSRRNRRRTVFACSFSPWLCRHGKSSSPSRVRVHKHSHVKTLTKVNELAPFVRTTGNMSPFDAKGNLRSDVT